MIAREHPEEVAEKYWQKWQENFDYVYVLFTDEDTVNPLPNLLKLVYEGDRFQLYRIAKAADAANSKERFSGRERR